MDEFSKNYRTSPDLETELVYELRAFLAAKSGKAPDTLRFYEEKLSKAITFFEESGLQSVTDIRPTDVRAYLASLTKGHTLGGQHTHYRALRAFLKWCQREYALPQDPLQNVDAPTATTAPYQATSLDIISAILNTCDKRTFIGCRDDALIRFMLDTGVRASELLRLRLEDVNPETGQVFIRPETAKTKRPRVVFVDSHALRSLRAYLRRRKDDNPMLWVNRYRRPMCYTGLREILRRRAAQIGVNCPSPHSIRKAFATAMLRDGASLETIRALLGHTSLMTTQKYLCLDAADLQAAHRLHSPGDKL